VALRRTAGEAVRNAVGRADARAVCVELTYAADGARLNVTDDGQGFRPDDVAPGGALRQVLDRAYQVGGDAAVLTPPGGGTQVSFIVPFEGAAGDGCAPPDSEFPFFPEGADDTAETAWPARCGESYLG
jgi:signal transduction histidine kinase